MASDVLTESQTATQDPEKVYCRSVEEFYQPAARFQIAVHLQDFLDDQRITPTEFLHSSTLQRSYESFPGRTAIRQRVANAQTRMMEETPQERMRELARLEEEVAAQTAQHLHGGNLPDLNPAIFGMTVKALYGANPGFTGRFAIDAALTQCLRDCPSFQSKAERLLSFCTEDMPAEGVQVIDQVLGEILASGAAMEELLGWIGDYKTTIDVIIDLWSREPLKLAKASPVIKRLSGFLREWELEGCKTGLEISLHRILGQDTPLTTRSPGDLLCTTGLTEELLAIGALAAQLKRYGSFIGGRRTARLLDRRVTYLISEDRLEDVLRGKPFFNKMIDLFELDKVVVGDYSQRIVLDYLKRLLDHKEFYNRVLDCFKTVRQKLRAFADLQQRVQKSSFPAAVRQQYSRMMDEIQYTYLRTNSLFQKIAKDKMPSPDEVLEVAGMLVDGAFTEDKSVNWARDLLRQHARSPVFIRNFVATLRTAVDRAERLATFNERMVAAGINIHDITKLRVLLADDEEPARRYVEMILRDLGVTNIIVATNGRQAVELFAGHEDSFDLIICDWKMPGLSGLGFLKQVRSVRPGLPFLMVTALATLIAVEEAMAHDVTAYIAKPFAPEQLEEKILLLINR